MCRTLLTAVLLLSCCFFYGCATTVTSSAICDNDAVICVLPKADEAVAYDLSAEERFALMKPENAMSSADFEEKVLAAGGKVEFAFGDERSFAQCHASTLVETRDRKIIVAWFGGTAERNPDVGIWYSIYDGETWTDPLSIAKVEETAHWNPVLFKDNRGIIHLFFKVGIDVPRWSTWWMSSIDNGNSWNEPSVLVPGDIGGRGPVKNKAIILSDRRWCAPASTEDNVYWDSFMDFSSDFGETWQRSGDFPLDRKKFSGKGTIQPTVWESEPGHIHALLRSTCGAMLRSDSTDNGVTWCETYDTKLPNNNSGADLVQLEDGRLLLVLNPVSKNWGARTPLSLAVSDDNGETWSILAHLEDAPAETDPEFSYPAIVHMRDGVAICYTYNRDRVRCWFIPNSAL